MRLSSCSLLISICLLSALESGCSEKKKTTHSEDDFFGALFALSDEARIELSAKVPPSETASEEFEELLKLSCEAMGSKRGMDAAKVLNQVLFDQKGFQREIDNPDVQFMLLPYVLRKKRGSCLGLASLYLVLAHRLDLPVRGVLVPGHVFVRLDYKGTHANIELFHQGEFMPDDWYRKKWAAPEHASEYMKDLSDGEFLAVLRFNMGNEYRKQGKLLQAFQKYSRAAMDFPDFAEAHASMGLVYQMQGKLSQAQNAYDLAKKLQADLPGLKKNIAELKRQMGATNSGAPCPEQKDN